MKRTVFGLVLILPLVAGCGAGEGKVSGRVLFEGAPLPAGRVTFRPADSRVNSVSVELDEQGNYQAVLPAGEVKVSVDNSEWEPQPSLGPGPLPPGLPPEVKKAIAGSAKPKEGGGRGSKRYVKIPERYHQLETSELQFTVVRGEMKKDLELKR
jgi:hypothetical protein